MERDEAQNISEIATGHLAANLALFSSERVSLEGLDRHRLIRPSQLRPFALYRLLPKSLRERLAKFFEPRPGRRQLQRFECRRRSFHLRRDLVEDVSISRLDEVLIEFAGSNRNPKVGGQRLFELDPIVPARAGQIG